MTKLPSWPTSSNPDLASRSLMRSAVKLLVVSLMVFAVAFALRRLFFWDIKPVSWDYSPPQNGALEAAFLLLSIENIAAVVAIVATIFATVAWSRTQRKSREVMK